MSERQLWAACHGPRELGTWFGPPCRDLITPGSLYSFARFHLQRLTGDEQRRPQNRKHWRTPRPHTWKETLLLPNPKLDGFPQESPGSIFLAVCQRGSRMKFMNVAQCLAQHTWNVFWNRWKAEEMILGMHRCALWFNHLLFPGKE